MQSNDSKVIDLTENQTRQKNNIRALLEKFSKINLIGGLPARYENAFLHTKRENRVIYEIDTQDPMSIAEFLHEVPNKGRNYHVSLGPVEFPNDKTPDQEKSLLVLDLDINHDASTSNGIENYKKTIAPLFANHPNTFSVRTKSGGLHLYYYIPTEIIRELNAQKIVNLIDGVDLLSSNLDPDKMYCLIGPGSYSTHESHIRSKKIKYSIEYNAPIQPVPAKFIDFLKENRQQYSKWHTEELSRIKRNKHNSTVEDDPTNIQKAQAYVNEQIVEAADFYRMNGYCQYQGRRNDSLNRHAFHLASFGLSEMTFTQLAHQVNTLAFREPLSDEEFNSTIKSALEARIKSGETQLNTEVNLPDFDPYPHADVTHYELLERAKYVYKLREEQLANTQRGIKLLAYTTFYVTGLPVCIMSNPIDKILDNFQRRLSDSTIFTYASLSSEIRDLELQFISYKSEKLFNDDTGPIDIPANSTKGRPKSSFITNHPFFQAAVRRGLRPIYDRPNKHIIYKNCFYMVPPEPLSMLPIISEEQYQKQRPLIEEILEHFKHTITDPSRPEEFDYIKNFIASLCQNKQVQAFIVLHGPQGTGKSQFLKFLSLFVPSGDWTGARNPDAVFDRFANIGSLTTIDDCNLNTTKDLDALKSRVSDDIHTLEQKYKDAVSIKKNISIVAATNHKLTDIEFLHERRLVWFSSHARYTGPEYAKMVDSQCRRLLANGALGLAALYRYFSEFKITVKDWNFRTKAHLDLIKEVNQHKTMTSETNKWKLARVIDQVSRDHRRKEEIAIINLVANFGYMSNTKMHVPLCTPIEELQDYIYHKNFPNTTPDWLYTFNYYLSLHEGKVSEPRKYLQRINTKDKSTMKRISEFTSEMLNRKRPISEVTEGAFAPIDKKVIPTLSKESDIKISQKRLMVLNPVNEWIRRVSILSNGSVSTDLSMQILDNYNMMEIAEFLVNRFDEPTREECEEVFNAVFPGEKFGEFNVVDDSTSLDMFDSEDDQEDFVEDDSIKE